MKEVLRRRDMISPYWVMMGLIVGLTPIICWVFTRNQRDTCVPMNEVFTEIQNKRYYLHISGYLIIFVWKMVTDGLNEPITVPYTPLTPPTKASV